MSAAPAHKPAPAKKAAPAPKVEAVEEAPESMADNALNQELDQIADSALLGGGPDMQWTWKNITGFMNNRLTW